MNCCYMKMYIRIKKCWENPIVLGLARALTFMQQAQLKKANTQNRKLQRVWAIQMATQTTVSPTTTVNISVASVIYYYGQHGP